MPQRHSQRRPHQNELKLMADLFTAPRFASRTLSLEVDPMRRTRQAGTRPDAARGAVELQPEFGLDSLLLLQLAVPEVKARRQLNVDVNLRFVYVS